MAILTITITIIGDSLFLSNAAGELSFGLPRATSASRLLWLDLYDDGFSRYILDDDRGQAALFTYTSMCTTRLYSPTQLVLFYSATCITRIMVMPGTTLRSLRTTPSPLWILIPLFYRRVAGSACEGARIRRQTGAARPVRYDLERRRIERRTK